MLYDPNSLNIRSGTVVGGQAYLPQSAQVRMKTILSSNSTGVTMIK